MGFRICHILSGDLWAGAEVMAYNLIKGQFQVNLQNEICAVLLNYGRLEKELTNIGIKVVVFDEQTCSFAHILTQLTKFIKEFKPDIIHSHRYKENILALASGLLAGRLPVLATQHGMPERSTDNFSIKKRILQKLLFWIQARFIHRIVSVSFELKEKLVNELGFTRSKISVIHNGIELLNQDKIFDSKVENSFGSAGRFFPVKDYPFMIDIAAKVVDKNGQAKFILAGDGPQRNILEEKIEKLNLKNNFSLSGHVDNMPTFYQALNVYMNTSVHEGIPMSILEAMSFGLPIIAPKTGGIVEIVRDNVDGFLIEGRNSDDFASKCMAFIDDPDLVLKMGRNARERVEDCFSVHVMTEQYMDLYKSLIKH